MLGLVHEWCELMGHTNPTIISNTTVPPHSVV
jgi:hypothetical protein